MIDRWTFTLPTADGVVSPLDADADQVTATTNLPSHHTIMVPPDGLGNPEQAVEDTAYPQRDGAVHYSDWWEPRILTWPDVLVTGARECCVAGDCAALVEYVAETRRNKLDNPQANEGTAHWSTWNGANVTRDPVYLDAEGLPPIDDTLTSAFRLRRETGTDSFRIIQSVPEANWLPVNRPLTVSFWFYMPSTNSALHDVVVQIGGPGAFVDASANIDGVHDTWVRAVTTLTPDQGPWRDLYVGMHNQPVVDGDVIYLTGLQVEPGPTVTSFQPVPVPRVATSSAGAGDVVTNVETMKRAWRRRQDDIELWMHVNGRGPYGVIGRPRVARVDWLEGWWDAASMLLRFDCADQRLYLLDVDDNGNVVGDGTRSVVVPVSLPSGGRTYDRVYGVVRDHPPMLELAYGGTGDVFVDATVGGNVDVPATIVFAGLLHDPVLQNVTNGTEVRLAVDVPAGMVNRVTVDTDAGTVTVGGANRFGWVVGNPRTFRLSPGVNRLRLVDADPATATGSASVTWRNAVV